MVDSQGYLETFGPLAALLSKCDWPGPPAETLHETVTKTITALRAMGKPLPTAVVDELSNLSVSLEIAATVAFLVRHVACSRRELLMSCS